MCGNSSKNMKFQCKAAALGLFLILIFMYGYVHTFYFNTRLGKNKYIFQQRYHGPRKFEQENPCTKPMKPTSIPNMRISAKKCIEYIWERQVFEKAHSKECQEYRRRKGFSVLGGNITNDGDFPHMAALGWRSLNRVSYVGRKSINKWEFKCGGTIISPKYVITAAHCTYAAGMAYREPQIVRIGVANLVPSRVNNPKDIKIHKITKHPEYKAPHKYFDIALLELQAEITFGKNIQPACLWNEYSTRKLGKMSVASGWGLIDKKKQSDDLRAVDLELIDESLCDKFLVLLRNRNWSGLQNHQLCAGILNGGHDTCKGDSGGPLQVKIKLPALQGKMYYLVGVTSFGYSCGRASSPGVYTRIFNCIEWIESIVWKDENETFFNPMRR